MQHHTLILRDIYISQCCLLIHSLTQFSKYRVSLAWGIFYAKIFLFLHSLRASKIENASLRWAQCWVEVWQDTSQHPADDNPLLSPLSHLVCWTNKSWYDMQSHSQLKTNTGNCRVKQIFHLVSFYCHLECSETRPLMWSVLLVCPGNWLLLSVQGVGFGPRSVGGSPVRFYTDPGNCGTIGTQYTILIFQCYYCLVVLLPGLCSRCWVRLFGIACPIYINDNSVDHWQAVDDTMDSVAQFLATL